MVKYCMRKPKYKADINDLLSRAESELKYAEWDLKGKHYAPACFWSQQIAEKSLKALWLFYKEELYPKTHKLEKKLLKHLIKEEQELEKLVKSAKILDKFYIPTRYGGISGEERKHTRKQAEKAISSAEEILTMAKKLTFPFL